MEHFADDCVFYMPRGAGPRGDRYDGKAEVRAGLAKRFAGIPDVHYGKIGTGPMATDRADGEPAAMARTESLSPAHVYTVWPTEPEGLLSTPAAGSALRRARLGIEPDAADGHNDLDAHLRSVAAGWAMIAFGVCYLLTDVRHIANPVWPVQVFGRMQFSLTCCPSSPRLGFQWWRCRAGRFRSS
jgi:hypothetical protein